MNPHPMGCRTLYRTIVREMQTFLTGVRRRSDAEVGSSFPWSVPTLASLERLSFAAPVTFFIGENGSGKSTFLEALAVMIGAVTIGAEDAANDATLDGARRLADTFVASRRGRPSTCAFFRAEDAFGFTRRIEREMRAIDAESERILSDGQAGMEARRRAAAYVRAQGAALTARYGDDPHALSHGETFLNILRERIVPNGLYLLDEPETPLSPTRVLALIVLLNDAVRVGSQFIIATHSPILAAFPNAEILLFEDGAIHRTAYEELEHVRVTRDFLAAPERYLRQLLLSEDDERR